MVSDCFHYKTYISYNIYFLIKENIGFGGFGCELDSLLFALNDMDALKDILVLMVLYFFGFFALL